MSASAGSCRSAAASGTTAKSHGRSIAMPRKLVEQRVVFKEPFRAVDWPQCQRTLMFMWIPKRYPHCSRKVGSFHKPESSEWLAELRLMRCFSLLFCMETSSQRRVYRQIPTASATPPKSPHSPAGCRRSQAETCGRKYQKKAQIFAGFRQYTGPKRTHPDLYGHETW